MLNEQTENNGKFQDVATEYMYKGGRWSFSFQAESVEDAEARMAAIRETGVVLGWPCYTIPVPVPESTPNLILHMIGNILVRIVAMVKNSGYSSI